MPVHYNPANPHESAVFVGLTATSFAQAGLGLAIVGVAIGYHRLTVRGTDP